jgi:hypothetical protein
MTRSFRGKKDSMLEPSFKGKGTLPVCETFDRDAFDIVLAKPGCVGLRVYFAMDETNKVRLVIVGVNENNEDMLPSSDTTATMTTRSTTTETDGDATEDDGDIIEDGVRCPDLCPPPSPLNS